MDILSKREAPVLLILNISDFALALSLEQNFCEMKDGGPKTSVSLV